MMMPVLFIMNEIPNYCPMCGRQLQVCENDFYGFCSHTCPKCKAHFQYARTGDILDAADKSGGDMKERWCR